MKLRVYLDLSNAATRRRVAALLRADGEVALVGIAEDADLVVSERVVSMAAPGAVAHASDALTARELDVLSGDSVGKKVSLDVLRAGKRREIEVVIGERPRRVSR